MRDLLRGYADQGGTVLLSSHLLHEIEVVADDLVVIGNGRIVASGTKGELLASAGPTPAPPTPGAWPPLPPRPGTRPRLAGRLRTDADAAEVGRIALAAGVPLTELARRRRPASRRCSSSSPRDDAREDVAA